MPVSAAAPTPRSSTAIRWSSEAVATPGDAWPWAPVAQPSLDPRPPQSSAGPTGCPRIRSLTADRLLGRSPPGEQGRPGLDLPAGDRVADRLRWRVQGDDRGDGRAAPG